MKRKFLAALLALVMVFSMIPVSASAAGNVTVTGDEPITDNDRSVSFHLYTTQLYKLIMLEDNSATADSDVSGVSLLLYDGFGVLDSTELSLRKIGVTKAETDYFEYSNTNRGHALEPNNIKGLKISYSTGDSQKEITIDASDLLLHCERGDLNLTADYTIMSSNTDKSIVAFYDNGGNAQGVNYSLYDAYLIPRNTTMQSHGIWPETPSYIAYHFVNWDLNKAGGSPFLQTSVVDGDKEVFSQKSALGDETIGTEIHVINTQNELKTRFVELYNAANDPDITVDDINWDTIKVSVADTDGKETNPNYNTGALPNEWREYQGETYYWVQNFDADLPGLEDTSYYNEHIAFDKITSMTVSADVNGQTYTYTIYKGSDKGDFAVSQLAGNTHIIEIHILAKPEKPDSDDLIGTVELPGILANGTVAIDCTTNNNHSTKTYGLKEGTYSVSDVKWSGSSSDGYYYADVTIVDFKPYVMEYGDGHTPAENQGNDTTITVMYDNTAGAWTVPTNEIPVTYNVVCTTEPGGGPEAPDVKIQVLCTNIEHSGIAQATYDLIEGTYEESMSKIDNVYTYSVTVSADKYVSRFSTESSSLHKLDSDYPYSDTIVYTYDGGSWQASGKDNLTFFVTCAEGGEEQPETPPTIDEDGVIDLMGSEAIKVVCETEGSGHNPSSYRLIPESFTVGPVTADGNGQYSCVITIDEDGILQYVDAYDEVGGSEHTAISFGPITFTITHDGTKWLQPSKLPAATIKVECVPDQEDELDEGDLNEILGGAITVQCVSEEDHGYKTLTLYELLENAYSFTKNENGTYTVTLDGEKYASAYGSYVSDKIGKGENIPHQLVNEENADFEIRLMYDGIKWTFDPDPIVIEVTCEDDSGDEPVEPTPTPTPDPTPTPGPGGGDKPPYIPPVDPDDSGVSDLLNTDDHIQYLFGYPEGTFGPENNMTRAEVAQMFYNLLLDQDVTITKTFDDVPANAWYAKAVNTLASLGVVSGVGNGDFEPERSITRAEFTSIAMKFAEGKTGGTNIFSDVKSTDWFYRAVVNSTQYGWIHGYGDGTFRPNNPITRVEVTAIVNNMLGREADVDFVTEHYNELNHFSDLVVSHWGYYHIVEATNDHDYTKPSSGENWTELN